MSSRYIPDFLLPDSWYPHEMQSELLAAKIKTPVYTSGLSAFLDCDVPDTDVVFVPAFGGSSLRHIYDATGGNPIASIPRDDMCVIITPTLAKFSYSKTVHGVPVRVRDMLSDEEANDFSDEELEEILAVEPGHLPSGFRENALDIQQLALTTVADHAGGWPFAVLGAKLSPLTSGKGNIAIFVQFPRGCPFDKQVYLDSGVYDNDMKRNIQIRVIPRPVVTSFDDELCGVKFTMKFLSVDNALFDKAFPLIQHVISKTFVASNLRFIKPVVKTGELVGLVQTTNDVSSHELATFKQALASIKFSPYVLVDTLAETTVIE